MSELMTREKHKQKHVELHEYLDELIADWIKHTGCSPSRGSIMDLLIWSSKQMLNPAD